MAEILSYFSSNAPIAWLVLAVALMSLEVLLPGVHFLWFGAAALAVAALAAFTPVSTDLQLIAFPLLSLATVWFGRGLTGRNGEKSADAPSLNERGHQYIGRTVMVEEAIKDGRGRVRVGDTEWLASGPDSPHGATVRVTGVDGTVLRVEPA